MDIIADQFILPHPDLATAWTAIKLPARVRERSALGWRVDAQGASAERSIRRPADAGEDQTVLEALNMAASHGEVPCERDGTCQRPQRVDVVRAARGRELGRAVEHRGHPARSE